MRSTFDSIICNSGGCGIITFLGLFFCLKFNNKAVLLVFSTVFWPLYCRWRLDNAENTYCRELQGGSVS